MANPTKQQIFNRVWKHFITKGAPRATRRAGTGKACVYINKHGDRCAVGVLLTREEAVRAQKKGGAANDVPMPKRLQRNLEFLVELQRVHDQRWSDDMTPVERRYALVSFASIWGLEVPQATP